MFATSNVLPRKDWGNESQARGDQSADLQAGDQVEGTVRNKIILQIKLFEISFSILVAGCRLLDLKPRLKTFQH